MHPTNCLNCGSNLESYKFCPACGQKATTHRLSFHDLWHDLLHYFTHADKSIFRLVGALAVRPGVVAREYVDGKRAKYFKPVNLFLVVGSLLVLILGIFHLQNEEAITDWQRQAAAIRDVNQQKLALERVERLQDVYHYGAKYSNVLNMLVSPLTALIFWLFYKKARYSYIEHLVASMFFISFVMLFNTLLIVPWQSKINVSVSWIFFLIPDVIYRSFAYRQFMGRRGIGPLLKAMGVMLVAVFVWLVISNFLIQLYIITGFK
ncbi:MULTISPECIES: DUF3667 domain-containing protein [Niastella]|uniref:DUF3667 domain-containing protein n=1 Tax=Niastella soli TaxID=2821487 RepID=A0ABS3Z0F1_9BACT|nr:DUF3667 domain-containing protein [Niastella soli]MBO9203628.1 DUF3667 domain-containing protein [Niastella soli]